MLHVDGSSWFSSVFVYYGGVFPRLGVPFLLYTFYSAVVYKYCSNSNFELSHDGLKFIAGATTFMLVFRLNQCYSRLQRANDMFVDAICGLRAIVGVTCANLCNAERSGKLTDEQQQAVTMCKLHICRLSVALAVSLKMHLRMAEMTAQGEHRAPASSVRYALFDLLRIKGLLSGSEAKLVEAHCGLVEEEDGGKRLLSATISRLRGSSGSECGRNLFAHQQRVDEQYGCALPPLLMMLLRLALNEPLSKSPWGYPERCMSLYEGYLCNISDAYQGMTQMVMCQLPLPYVQLCKVLLLVFILAYPVSIEIEHGIWGNVVVPSILAMTLIGFETVADFLENPMGDDSEDISIYEFIHEFEVEVQAAFNCYQVHRRSIVASWEELGRHLGAGRGTELLSRPEDDTSRHGFNDFFEWAPLPPDIADYIQHQSADVGRVNARAFGRTLRCCRRNSSRAEADDSEESLGLAGAEDDSECSMDGFSISRCLVLRGDLPHLREARRQLRAVARVGKPSGPESFRHALKACGAGDTCR